jgi:hypothetical protein
MNKLVFIDDDKRELDGFGALIDRDYTCTLLHWPNDRDKLFSGPSPDLFVSDLYLPSADGDHKPNPEQIQEAASTAREVSHRFHNLYAGGAQAVESIEMCKARLRDTMTPLRMPMKSCSDANGRHWANLLTTELHCWNRSGSDFPRCHSFFIPERSIQRMRSKFSKRVLSMQSGKVSISKSFWHVSAMRNDLAAGGDFCSPKTRQN